MRRVPRALAIGGLILLAGCERVSGLSELEFACVPEPIEETCAGLACGGAVDRCGGAVTCPDACAPPFACEVGGVAPNTCGCTGGPNATPPPPEGCAAIPGTTGNTYFACDFTADFVGAREICQASGTDLVIIETPLENGLLRQSIPGDVFIGLWDEDCAADACTYEWVDGTLPTFTRWRAGEPNNTGGGEHCAQLIKIGGGWNDVSCDNRLRFLCETTCPE
jgi:hypothetical protein